MTVLVFCIVVGTISFAVIGGIAIITLALWSFVRDVAKEIR